MKRESINQILAHHSIRKSKAQKVEFIQWMQKHSETFDYSLHVHLYKKGKGKNLVIGDPANAKLFLTAHYDTAPTAIIPVTTLVSGWRGYAVSQLGVIGPVVALSWLFYFLLSLIFGDLGVFSIRVSTALGLPIISMIFIFLWSQQMMFGFANKSNANDNTSGVAVLLAVIEDMPKRLRNNVCFIFFDEEEKGLEGAKAFKRSHRSLMKGKPLINFDCVGHGKQLIFIVKNEFYKSLSHKILCDVVGNRGLIKPSKKMIYPSDQWVFPMGVGVTATHWSPVIGYYLSRLHSKYDHFLEETNIETLKEIAIDFITILEEGER